MIPHPASVAVPPHRGCGGCGLSDAEIESAIYAAALRLHTAPTPDERREAWAELTRLHGQRSTTQVERMEQEKGLR